MNEYFASAHDKLWRSDIEELLLDYPVHGQFFLYYLSAYVNDWNTKLKFVGPPNFCPKTHPDRFKTVKFFSFSITNLCQKAEKFSEVLNKSFDP